MRLPKQSANQQKSQGSRREHAAGTLSVAASRGQAHKQPAYEPEGCAHSSHLTLAPHLEFKDPPPRFCPSAHVPRTAALAQSHTAIPAPATCACWRRAKTGRHPARTEPRQNPGTLAQPPCASSRRRARPEQCPAARRGPGRGFHSSSSSSSSLAASSSSSSSSLGSWSSRSVVA